MECFTEVLPGTKAAPHNYVCGSQRIFCTSSAVSKTGNTYSIPSFWKLCTGTKSLAELPCQIMRCCPKYKCVGGLSVFGSPPLKLRGGLFGEFPVSIELKEKVLTDENKKKAKKGLKIAAIIFGVIVLIDVISLIIYVSLYGFPQ